MAIPTKAAPVIPSTTTRAIRNPASVQRIARYRNMDAPNTVASQKGFVISEGVKMNLAHARNTNSIEATPKDIGNNTNCQVGSGKIKSRQGKPAQSLAGLTSV